jgi:hypothetical protein
VEANKENTLPPETPRVISQYESEEEINLLYNQPRKPNTRPTYAGTPCSITADALYHVLGKSLSENWSTFCPHRINRNNPYDLSQYEVCHEANGVVHPVTKETITKYEKLMNDPHTMRVWREAFCKELGRLAGGWKNTEGTNTIVFMTYEQIRNIPKDRTVTYA